MRVLNVIMQEVRREFSVSLTRVIAAVAGGIAGAVVIWITVPYNNFVLNNAHMSDSYLPGIVLVLLCLAALLLNPILRRLAPRFACTRSQLALMLGVWLVASTLPSFGLLMHLPYALANVVRKASIEAPVAKMHAEINVRPSLFPADVTGSGSVDPRVAEGFLDQLAKGESIPWAAWVPPLISWGTLLLANWLLMLGLAAILFPQWRDRERLAFPLLDVYGATIEDPPEGGAFAGLFRQRLFWVGCLLVLTLHSFNGLNLHTDKGFPGFPLDWDLSACFTEGMWRNIGWAVRSGRIYFAVVGVSYLCSSRISFSLWFGVVGYAVWTMIATTYLPTVSTAGESDQRIGAAVAMSLFILWLSRRHWANVGLAMIGRGGDATTDGYNRQAGWMFTAGCMGIFLWFVWAGVPGWWSALFLLVTFMVSLVMARIVAETGVPVLRIQGCEATRFMTLFPSTTISVIAMYMESALEIIVNRGSRVSAAVMGMHALGLNRDRAPRILARLSWGLIAVLAMGLVVCGATHLRASYHNAAPWNGGSSPINPYGVGTMDGAVDRSIRLLRGQDMAEKRYNRGANIAVGFALTGVLMGGCAATPSWPLHPIGIFFGSTWYGQRVWWSFFFGWLLKMMVTRLGGARGYRAVRPLCLGLILGEALAFVLWAIIPLLRLLAGADPANALRMPQIM